MRIFDRYIGRQVLVATLIAVLVLSVVMVLGNVFKRLLSLPTEVLRDMPVGLLIRFVGYALVASLPFTIPWSLLTAVLLVFGRMSADNELLAVRMAGWSFARVCAPIFVLAGAFTALCFWINVQVAPQAETEIKRLPTVVATDNPKALLAADRVIDQVDDFIIYIGAKEGPDVLRDFQMIMLNERSFPSAYVVARRVEVSENRAEQGLDLKLHDVVSILRDEVKPGMPESGERNIQRIKAPLSAGFLEKSIPLTSLYAKLDRVTPGMMTMAQLSEELARQEQDAGRPREKGRRKRKEGSEFTPEQKASELRTEWHRRLSFSLASLVFALVGVPLGVTAQRRETSVGFALSLLIGIIYLTFFILGDSVLKNNPAAHPHLLVWAPNVLFLLVGGWFFLRQQRR